MARESRPAYRELSLQQLRSFREVCERGGYAPAARVLFLTTPAVWEQVQALERHYGVPLLQRDDRVIRPTVEGEHLLEIIRPLLAGLDASRDALQQKHGVLPARLALATNLRVLSEEISRSLRRFRDAYPQVRLWVTYTRSDVEQRVLSGEADVGFTLDPEPDLLCSPAAVYEPAGEVEYLLVTPPDHPLLSREDLHLRHIVEHPLVLADSVAYSRRRVQESLHRENLTQMVSLAVETSSDEYTLSCVRAGLGVGITIGNGRGHLYAGLCVRSLGRWLGAARVGFLWKRGAPVPPAQRALAQALRDCIWERPG